MYYAIRVFTSRLPARISVESIYVSGHIAFALVFAIAPPLKAIATKNLATYLETRIPRIELHPEVPVSGIIVLGGYHRRVHEAIKLADQFPEAEIIFSGPTDKELAILSERLPTTRGRIIDRRPTNTYENAVYSHELLKPQLEGCWLLVTSAMHMPRAMSVFNALDVPVAPWPISDTPRSFDDQHAWLSHELMGLVGYWFIGRTRELYSPYRSSGCHRKIAHEG